MRKKRMCGSKSPQPDLTALSNQVDTYNLSTSGTSSTSASDALTADDIKRAIDYWKSDEYQDMIYQNNVREAETKMMLHNALAGGFITEREFMLCYYHISDGYIVMSSTFYKDIEPKLKRYQDTVNDLLTGDSDSK